MTWKNNFLKKIEILKSCAQIVAYNHARARAKPERAASVHIPWCQIPPSFSEMAGLIRSGIYTGNDQYVGQIVKFDKIKSLVEI